MPKMYREINRSDRGETFAEVLAALLVAALALVLLTAALSVWGAPKPKESLPPERGTVRLAFALSEMSYEADLDVWFDEGEYACAPP